MAFEPIQSTLNSPNVNLKVNSLKDLRQQQRLNKMLNSPVSIPGEYKANKKVSRCAKDFWQTLNLLSGVDRRSWWKQEKMAELTGQSARSIRRYIKELVEAGWLQVGKRNKSQVNLYTLINPEGYIDPREKSAKIKSMLMEKRR